MPKPMRRIRVNRSICGPVLIQFDNHPLDGFACALSEQDAIRLCDALRVVLETPTQAPPQGDNVCIMAAPTDPRT